jgi:hypothetical protein
MAAKRAEGADVIELVEKRRAADGTWVLQNRYPGKTFFEMGNPGQPPQTPPRFCDQSEEFLSRRTSAGTGSI